MSQSFEQGWQTGHITEAFPLRDAPASVINQIPDGFLIDLRLFLNGYTEIEVYISSIEYDSVADTYTLSFSSISDNTLLLQGALTRLTDSFTPSAFARRHLADGATVCLFTPGPAWDTPTWGGPTDWTQAYQANGSAIQAAQVIPAPRTIRRIFIDGEAIPPRNEWPVNAVSKLIGGYNVAFDVGGGRLPTSFGPSGAVDAIDITAVPGGGAGFPPADTGPLGYWAMVNNVPVSDNGNVVLAMQDCLRVSIPIDSENLPIANTLLLGSDCQPCCSCSEYRKLSRAEGRMSAKIKDACDEVTEIVQVTTDIYNMAISKINAKMPAMIFVNNLQATEATLTFSVINMSETVAYAYVAISASLTDLGAGDLGPMVPLEEPNVVIVPQSGAIIYPTINAHKETLPPLPFVDNENPLSSIPTNNFSEEIAGLLLAVGQKTKTSPFDAIGVGESIRVTINFPEVANDILSFESDLVEPERDDFESGSDGDLAYQAAVEQYTKDVADQRSAITLPGRRPRFKIRVVGVYGSSHSYACASFTYGATVQPVSPETSQQKENQKKLKDCEREEDDSNEVVPDGTSAKKGGL